MKDQNTGNLTGSGFIDFMSVEHATEALQQLDGTVLDNGQKLNLRFAKQSKPRVKTSRRGYGGDWGGGRRSEQFDNRGRKNTFKPLEQDGDTS